MDMAELLRQSWRITRTNRAVWALTLVMLLAFGPSVTLSAGFGAGAALVSVPWPTGPTPDWIVQLRQWPLWAWIIIAGVNLLVAVLTTALTWLVQAAALRSAVLAAEHGRASLREALRLGRRRVTSILTLSLTLGGLIGALGVLPVLIPFVLERAAPELGLLFLQSVQTVMAPILGALGLALYLVMMSVALEEVQTRGAFGRAWAVFRSGWWGFLLVFGLTSAASLGLALMVVPLLLVPIVALLLDQTAGLFITVCACAVGGPLGMALVLATAVYTQVLYALVYHAAARKIGPELSATPAPD